NTLQIMRGAVAAQKDGFFQPYVASVFRNMWEQGLKMDEPAVIRKALDDAGLEGARLLERIQDPEVKQALLENTERAFRRGAFGSPTFFVADEIFFGKDRLRDVEEEIARQA